MEQRKLSSFRMRMFVLQLIIPRAFLANCIRFLSDRRFQFREQRKRNGNSARSNVIEGLSLLRSSIYREKKPPWEKLYFQVIPSKFEHNNYRHTLLFSGGLACYERREFTTRNRQKKTCKCFMERSEFLFRLISTSSCWVFVKFRLEICGPETSCGFLQWLPYWLD